MISATQAELDKLIPIVKSTSGHTLSLMLEGELRSVDEQLRTAPMDKIGMLQGRASAIEDVLMLFRIANKRGSPHPSLLGQVPERLA